MTVGLPEFEWGITTSWQLFYRQTVFAKTAALKGHQLKTATNKRAHTYSSSSKYCVYLYAKTCHMQSSARLACFTRLILETNKI